MGFDIVYLPPIHPIGHTNRKGRTTPSRRAPRPRLPLAIGSGGRSRRRPSGLGTLDDFETFVRARRNSVWRWRWTSRWVTPDHPWAAAGKPWFLLRADGTIAYAENPPKKYQDIYPIWFDGDPAGIIAETLRLLHFWMDRGVRIFRVDNPHTKPVRFWDRCSAKSGAPTRTCCS